MIDILLIIIGHQFFTISLLNRYSYKDSTEAVEKTESILTHPNTNISSMCTSKYGPSGLPTVTSDAKSFSSIQSLPSSFQKQISKSERRPLQHSVFKGFQLLPSFFSEDKSTKRAWQKCCDSEEINHCLSLDINRKGIVWPTNHCSSVFIEKYSLNMCFAFLCNKW